MFCCVYCCQMNVLTGVIKMYYIVLHCLVLYCAVLIRWNSFQYINNAKPDSDLLEAYSSALLTVLGSY